MVAAGGSGVSGPGTASVDAQTSQVGVSEQEAAGGHLRMDLFEPRSLWQRQRSVVVLLCALSIEDARFRVLDDLRPGPGYYEAVSLEADVDVLLDDFGWHVEGDHH